MGGEIDIAGMEQIPIRIGKPTFEEHMAEFSECLNALSRPARNAESLLDPTLPNP